MRAFVAAVGSLFVFVVLAEPALGESLSEPRSIRVNESAEVLAAPDRARLSKRCEKR
ncbi:MAG: hypothetical protein ACI8TX_001631 [Hyphomicrobiaceae bacterium]|jgi:hypothetical protein